MFKKVLSRLNCTSHYILPNPDDVVMSGMLVPFSGFQAPFQISPFNSNSPAVFAKRKVNEQRFSSITSPEEVKKPRASGNRTFPVSSHMPIETVDEDVGRNRTVGTGEDEQTDSDDDQLLHDVDDDSVDPLSQEPLVSLGINDMGAEMNLSPTEIGTENGREMANLSSSRSNLSGAEEVDPKTSTSLDLHVAKTLVSVMETTLKAVDLLQKTYKEIHDSQSELKALTHSVSELVAKVSQQQSRSHKSPTSAPIAPKPRTDGNSSRSASLNFNHGMANATNSLRSTQNPPVPPNGNTPTTNPFGHPPLPYGSRGVPSRSSTVDNRAFQAQGSSSSFPGRPEQPSPANSIPFVGGEHPRQWGGQASSNNYHNVVLSHASNERMLNQVIICTYLHC